MENEWLGKLIAILSHSTHTQHPCTSGIRRNDLQLSG